MSEADFHPRQKCPKCASSLIPATYEGVVILKCEKCLGAFVPKENMILFLKDKSEHLRVSQADPSDQSQVSKCAAPGCGGDFRTFRLSPDYPLAIDMCERCGGFWFDLDELEQADSIYEAQTAKKEIDKDFRWFHGLFLFLTASVVEFNMKSRKKPIVVYAIILLNTCLSLAWWAHPDLDPSFTPAGNFDLSWLASLVASFFAQANLLHLLGNMYFLYIFGDNLEDVLGHRNFLLFYLAAGVAAGFVHALLSASPGIPFVGASGAISAVMGAYVIYFHFAKIGMPIPILWIWKKTRKIPCVYAIGFFLLQDLAGALLFEGEGGTAYWSHVGGAVFGLAFAKATCETIVQRNAFLKLFIKPGRRSR